MEPCASMSAFFDFKKEVDGNEMVDCCRRDVCVPAFIWTVLLYCRWGKRGQATGRTGVERQAGCRRGKRIEENMRRISPRTALIVTSGTVGNRNAERSDAIIAFRKKGRTAPAEKMGYAETVRSALMDGILPVSATACRRFSWICGSAARSKKEGDPICRMKSTKRL